MRVCAFCSLFFHCREGEFPLPQLRGDADLRPPVERHGLVNFAEKGVMAGEVYVMWILVRPVGAEVFQRDGRLGDTVIVR